MVYYAKMFVKGFCQSGAGNYTLFPGRSASIT
jgi:hypothetical protein